MDSMCVSIGTRYFSNSNRIAGDSHTKTEGCLLEILQRIPTMYQDYVLICGRAIKFFRPQEVLILKEHIDVQ